MEFVLKGFDHAESVRRFRFESIAADRSRSTIVVSADLALARECGVQVQSLPLICRQLLEGCDATAIAAGFMTVTRANMAAVSKAARELVEQKKPRRSRPPVSNRVGNAWRGPGNALPGSRLT